MLLRMIHQETLSNGLHIIVEEMPHVESVAYELQIPGGILEDSPHSIGAALVLSELTGRGAGVLDSRALSEAFESAGIRHGESASLDRYSMKGILLKNKLNEALRLIGLMVLKPTLPAAEIEPIQSLIYQDIQSIRDEPSREVMVELSARYYPAPYNRPTHGSMEGVKNINRESLREQWANQWRPDGSCISIAGNVSASAVISEIKKIFGSWSGKAKSVQVPGKFPDFQKIHIKREGAQVQLAVAFPGAPFGDPDYYAAKMASGVLSGGMAGRLFIEVREKRGLVYSVYARHTANQFFGTNLVYAGTTPPRVQETYDVILHELKNLAGTVKPEELKRSRSNLCTSLVMQDESSGGRASSNASDHWLARRVRSLEEIVAAIEGVKEGDIDRLLSRFPCAPHSVITLGVSSVNCSSNCGIN
jgi:predicted Zn-dependent peptidase